MAPRRSRRGRWFVATVIAALVLTWAMVGVTRPQVAYETVAVSRGDVETAVAATGILQPRRYVDVGAQVSGLIVRLHVQPGDIVKQGQLLVEIDPSVQQAIVDAGRAAIAGLRAQLAEETAQHRLAERQLERHRRLAAANAIAQQDLDAAATTFASTAARIARFRAEIEQTQASQRADEARLGYTRIYAPMAGTVVSVESRTGQTLNATYQTPDILRIADLSSMTVWTDVSEADIHQIRAGMPVHFTTLGASARRRWSGTVSQVLPAPPKAGGAGQEAAPSAATKAVTYTVLFDVANRDGMLLPQMTALVTFTAARAENALLVPLSALRREGDRSMARVLGVDDRVQERALRLGIASRHEVQVLGGLAEGDRLVTAEKVNEPGWSWLRW